MIPAPVMMLETAEQLRALAEPLRQRLLHAFAAPATVKMAASAIGQPVTKLYHHVDQLLAAGLVTVVGETRRRATVERTFQVSARRFVAVTATDAAERPAERERIVREAVEALLSNIDDAPGALRLLRARGRLDEAGLAAIEAALTDLIARHERVDAPEHQLIWFAARAPR